MNALKTLVLMQLKDKVDFSFMRTKKALISKIILTIRSSNKCGGCGIYRYGDTIHYFLHLFTYEKFVFCKRQSSAIDFPCDC